MRFTMVDAETHEQVAALELRHSPVIGMTIRVLGMKGDDFMPGVTYEVVGVEEVAVAVASPVNGVKELLGTHSILYVRIVGEADTRNARPKQV